MEERCSLHSGLNHPVDLLLGNVCGFVLLSWIWESLHSIQVNDESHLPLFPCIYRLGPYIGVLSSHRMKFWILNWSFTVLHFHLLLVSAGFPSECSGFLPHAKIMHYLADDVNGSVNGCSSLLWSPWAELATCAGRTPPLSQCQLASTRLCFHLTSSWIFRLR